MEKNFEPTLIYPTELSFQTDGDVTYFHDKEHLGKFINTKPALQNVLKDILERDDTDESTMNPNRRNPPGKANN